MAPLLGALFRGAGTASPASGDAIGTLLRTTGHLIDPHSAIGIAAGLACHDDKTCTLVSLATAHPAKFPDAVAAATGITPPLPPALSDLMERPERCDVLPNDAGALKEYVRKAGGRA